MPIINTRKCLQVIPRESKITFKLLNQTNDYSND